MIIGTVTSGVVAYTLPNTSGARVLWGTGSGSYRRAGTTDRPWWGTAFTLYWT